MAQRKETPAPTPTAPPQSLLVTNQSQSLHIGAGTLSRPLVLLRLQDRRSLPERRV
jgi:hypothetical protein